ATCRKLLGGYFWRRLTSLFFGQPREIFILFRNVEEDFLRVSLVHFLGLFASIFCAEAPIARVLHPRRHFRIGHANPQTLTGIRILALSAEVVHTNESWLANPPYSP